MDGNIDTEIDWTAYMQQVSHYIDGERDYAKIHGDTGPLVYPAIHVYIYRILYAVTNGGSNILLAQCYFAILYLCNLGLVMACYRLAKVRFLPVPKERLQLLTPMIGAQYF